MEFGRVVQIFVDGVVLICHFLAIIVIFLGIVKSLIIFIKDALFKMSSAESFRESRIELGHAFSLGLGFLIGASILNTTLAPTWNDIGQLASIIVLRTFLNFFMMREIDSGLEKRSQNKNNE